MNNNKLLANMYKKAIELNGQNIFADNNSYKAIVKYKNNIVINNELISIVGDELIFIVDKSFKINDQITYKNKIYKVTAIDDTVEPYFTYYTKYYNVAKNYSIEAINNYSMEVGSTYKISVTCKEDYIIVESPEGIKYSSSNETVATVSEDGTINALKEGSCKIICSWNGVSCEIDLTVTEVETIAYTINGADSIRKGLTETYTIEPQKGTIVIEVDDYSDSVEITNQDTYFVTLKCLAYGEFITINVYDSLNSLVATKDVTLVR